eukprot:TRINITY_DN1053_c0_g1_i3.p1 TRINITY_DN1053_c0_g1~~TRINITY_DN1053_c0_g1_i3.p1  ORF type:complete len:170 (+),score=43.34 TRINITY_DN1053_c0_g1_i3:288-797(+)
MVKKGNPDAVYYGVHPSAIQDDMIKLSYNSFIADNVKGNQIETTYKRTGPQYKNVRMHNLPLGLQQVVEKMFVGDQFEAFIPPQLAPGTGGGLFRHTMYHGGGLPPNTSIIFKDAILVDISSKDSFKWKQVQEQRELQQNQLELDSLPEEQDVQAEAVVDEVVAEEREL